MSVAIALSGAVAALGLLGRLCWQWRAGQLKLLAAEIMRCVSFWYGQE